jgi:hypothetical protein
MIDGDRAVDQPHADVSASRCQPHQIGQLNNINRSHDVPPFTANVFVKTIAALAFGKRNRESQLLAARSRPTGIRSPPVVGRPGGRETPNLMLGLARIGYHYLRLDDPLLNPLLLLVSGTSPSGA